MSPSLLALSGRIRRALDDLKLVVDRSELIWEKAFKSDDDAYLDALALNLHGFYTGVEKILEDIARTVDQSIPQGAEWHSNLLLQLCAEIPSVRPPVITSETREYLDELRGFRHVVRNVYTFQFQPSRIEALTRNLRQCYQCVRRDLLDFCDFLEKLADTRVMD